jgi:hypothetical protein
MAYHTYILVLCSFIAFTTVNTRSIQEEADIEQLVENRINANKELSAKITSFRHRFEHSPNFKALRWALSQQAISPYCDFCAVFVPIVSLMNFSLFMLFYSHVRFGFSSKLIRRLTLKILQLLCVEISNFFST